MTARPWQKTARRLLPSEGAWIEKKHNRLLEGCLPLLLLTVGVWIEMPLETRCHDIVAPTGKPELRGLQ